MFFLSIQRCNTGSVLVQDLWIRVLSFSLWIGPVVNWNYFGLKLWMTMWLWQFYFFWTEEQYSIKRPCNQKSFFLNIIKKNIFVAGIADFNTQVRSLPNLANEWMNGKDLPLHYISNNHAEAHRWFYPIVALEPKRIHFVLSSNTSFVELYQGFFLEKITLWWITRFLRQIHGGVRRVVLDLREICIFGNGHQK